MSAPLQGRHAVAVFLAFAFGYFFSALVRGITATLSTLLTQEFALHARDLGLLSGGYFLGFAATQLPLGTWLDRYGPKRVLLCFLAVAAAGCVAFAHAQSFAGLLAARVLCGIGLSACLMAPLTGYRRWFSPVTQLRTSSWMLMTGSMGMVASTLPVQWLTPLVGWRVQFIGLALLLVASMLLIALRVPSWERSRALRGTAPDTAGYAVVWRHPYFRRMAPLGFFCYGGLLAVQTLWAAPWMVTVAHFSPLQAATGLFCINIAMLMSFWLWGLAGPMLARRGLHADKLIARGLPVSFVLLALLIVLPERMVGASGVLLVLYCMASSFVTPSQPAVGMAFGPEAAGRALSAYNLAVFVGVFVLQWGIGLVVDGLVALGLEQGPALRCAFAMQLLACIGSYVYFRYAPGHNGRP